MQKKPKSRRRSGCPVSVSLDIFGDRWSLLIVRDMMVRGHRTFKEFLTSGEGIATNILTDRLQKLEASGILIAEAEEKDARRINYRLTEKGIDLAPVLLELLIWATKHEETGAPCNLIAQMAVDREQVLAETRRRWRERDPTPLLPRFDSIRNDQNLNTKFREGAKHEQSKSPGRHSQRSIHPHLRRQARRLEDQRPPLRRL